MHIKDIISTQPATTQPTIDDMFQFVSENLFSEELANREIFKASDNYVHDFESIMGAIGALLVFHQCLPAYFKQNEMYSNGAPYDIEWDTDLEDYFSEEFWLLNSKEHLFNSAKYAIQCARILNSFGHELKCSLTGNTISSDVLDELEGML